MIHVDTTTTTNGNHHHHQQQQQEEEQEQRQLKNRGHKSSYYQFQESNGNSNSNGNNNTPTTLSDVWLCLACALGWSIWLVSTRQPPQQLIFEQEDSSKAMGHVLQVSLGEDILGTGIPVYYALVDFVAKGDTDEDHIQVRKVFTSKKILEEGFANVEVLYLTNDPTIAILMDDLLDQKSERETQAPPSTTYFVVIYVVSVLLIGTSLYGGIRMANRLDTPLYATASVELSGIGGGGGQQQQQQQGQGGGRRRRRGRLTPKHLLFPNAGCGFGNFNVHLPTGRQRASSSVSSMSASASQHSTATTTATAAVTDKVCCGGGGCASSTSTSGSGCGGNIIVRNDTSILEKYELHVSTNANANADGNEPPNGRNNRAV
eukprot:jgi/Psemu1/325124/estExt_fgenesh1_pg.C_2080004